LRGSDATGKKAGVAETVQRDFRDALKGKKFMNENTNPGQNQESNFPRSFNGSIFRVTKVHVLPVDTIGKTRAFVDVRVGPAILHGFCVIATDKGGLFVAPPAKLTKDKKNFPYVSLDEDFKGILAKAVIRAYQLQRSANETGADVDAADLPF
jgi:DNA-binding cell septation regulator SpoVG